MADKDSALRVVSQNNDGRRRYDEKGKRALVEAALLPGVSVAHLAQEHRINANLLRKWISKYPMEREKGLVPASQDKDADKGDLPPAVEVIDGVAIGPRVRSSASRPRH
ncbi:transposase [Burkholderia cepacia]|uniref:transposase n=1 Tax=Burkholderia cepacia TaxID=292 RepID=UPI003C7EBFA8